MNLFALSFEHKQLSCDTVLLRFLPFLIKVQYRFRSTFNTKLSILYTIYGKNKNMFRKENVLFIFQLIVNSTDFLYLRF